MIFISIIATNTAGIKQNQTNINQNQSNINQNQMQTEWPFPHPFQIIPG